MRIPNNVGYVAECLEERPLVLDEETSTLVPGEIQVRFKLKLRNTLGKELIVFARLEDPSLRGEINDFLNPKTMVFSSNTVPELAEQLVNDLSKAKDFHDKIVDNLEAEVRKRIDAYLAQRLV
jgi:hypothetical protein